MEFFCVLRNLHLGYENTFDTIKDKLLDRLGGELRVRHENGKRYLDYLQTTAEHKKTKIHLAKNLKSIQKKADAIEIITRLVPLEEKLESEDDEATDASQARLTIKSVNDGKDYIDDKSAMKVFGVITRSEKWDDITQPNQLKATGLNFSAENNRVKIQYELNALDLALIDLDIDYFEQENYHPVINPVMAIDEELRIIEKTIDILKPETSTLKIGDQFKTAAAYQRESNRSRRQIIELEQSFDMLNSSYRKSTKRVGKCTRPAYYCAKYSR